MRRQSHKVKSGHETQAGRSLFLVDNLLGVIKAATTLHFAAKAGIDDFRSCGALPRGLSHFAFSNSVADAYDHGRDIIDNANYSQEILSMKICSSDAGGQQAGEDGEDGRERRDASEPGEKFRPPELACFP